MNTRLNKKVKKDLDAYFKGFRGSDPEVHHGLKHILIGALIDANFHSEAKQVQNMFPKAKQSKYYGRTDMEDSIEQNHGVPIAKSAKWDGYEIIDAISFFASMFIGGPVGAKITSLKEGMNENVKMFIGRFIKEVTHSHEYEDMSSMGEDENDKEEIKIGEYQTKYFHVCPGASSLYGDIESKGVDMDMAERSVRLQDALFFIEEHVGRDGYSPDKDYVMVAKNIAKNIMKMGKMMGLEKEHSYIQGHVDTIIKSVEGKKLEERVIELTEKNTPTDPAKWAASKAAAKKKFDVYPSAYANAWAAKNYKGKGGGWRTTKESVNENDSYSITDDKGRHFLLIVGEEPKDSKGKSEYKKDGFYISPQKGFKGLITAYFKDEKTLKRNIDKKYHNQLGESINEATSKYPNFDLDKNIRYQSTSISSGMWRYTGKEQGGKGVYRNLNNNQFLGFSSDDFKYFKKHLKKHFDIDESVNEGKNHKSKDSRGVRFAEAVYNNVSAIVKAVEREKMDVDRVVNSFGPVLVNAIKTTLKHKFKPTAGNEDKLDDFYDELKELLKVAESLVKRPSKSGVTKLDASHRTWWNHNGGADVVLNGKYADNIVESINESKFMDKNKKFKVYDKLKKGDKIRIKFGNSIRKDNEAVLVVTKGKTIVGKQKVERIILKNPANPSGVKYYLYNRDGNVSLAKGDMAAVIVDMIPESVNESLNHNDMYTMLDIAAGYSSTQHEAAGQMWSDEQDLYDYLKSDHIPKKYHKKFYNDIKRRFKGVNESVNEAKEPEVITQLRKIVKDSQNDLIKDTKSGKKVRVDMGSANLIVKVYDALKKQSNKDKFVKSGIAMMGHTAYKLMKKEDVSESGIMYKAGVKKYGKEGMTKIQSAAGKGEGHEEIGKIKDKYDKSKKESVNEAEYQGRKVELNKPMQGDSKKFKVYVKNEKGNVVVVHFGAKGMNIKKNNPKARKSFRARMNCDNPGPKWKANYWSCRKW